MNERLNDFLTLWRQYAPEESDDLVIGNNLLMDYLEGGGFFTAPASTKYHGAYPGGLYDHSKQVFLQLKDLTEKNDLEWERPESPFIIGMFHDLCKCDQYKIKPEIQEVLDKYPDMRSEVIPEYEYNTNTLLKGHGEKSVMILSQFMRLTEEEVLCIRYHMGAYENDDWQGFDLAIRKFPTTLWTHVADMLASKVIGT